MRAADLHLYFYQNQVLLFSKFYGLNSHLVHRIDFPKILFERPGPKQDATSQVEKPDVFAMASGFGSPNYSFPSLLFNAGRNTSTASYRMRMGLLRGRSSASHPFRGSVCIYGQTSKGAVADFRQSLCLVFMSAPISRLYRSRLERGITFFHFFPRSSLDKI